MQIIHLDDSDDIISICDRLTWAEAQQALLVLPEDGGVLREGLDLVRLRRFADRQRLEVGLVTPDVPITQQARALGLPVFPSVQLAENSRQGWWRGRKRSERVGLPTVGDGAGEGVAAVRPYPPLDPGDRQEMNRRLRPQSIVRLWLVRYAAIFLFCLTLAILYTSFTYAVPGATITLQPETETIHVERAVIADPAVESVNYGLNTVPARLLTTTESWQTNVATTGLVELPDAPARGSVLLVNQLAQAVVVPAGTRVSTSDGSNVVFQTLAAVTLAEAVGSTAEVEVIAEAPGPEGNVAANLVNRVQGSLDLQVEVRNLEPMTGGALRETAAVSANDQERLRAQALQFLQAVALANMEAQLTEREFISKDTIRVVNILDETFSHDVGEQTAELTLVLRAELQGTAVDTTVASGLAFESLGQAVPPGFVLVPDSIRFSSGNVVAVDESGRVTFSMIGEGVVAANLALEGQITAVTGQNPETAAVSAEDHERLRAQALQFLQAVALANMEAQLTEREFISKDTIRVVTVLDETFSHDVGEQTAELTLVMRAELQGTAVDTTVASGLAFDSLGQVVPAGFTLVPDSIRFSSGNVVAVDDSGRVTFSMIGEGIVAANLALDGPITAVIGQNPEMAAAYLYQQLPLRAVPTLNIWPIWFDRVPYLATRIQTVIEP